MLVTPLGEIMIQIDSRLVPYETVQIELTQFCKDLDGRYRISIPFFPDGKKHEISCFINGHLFSDMDYIETGERLELKSFYEKTCKISIGMEGDSGYFSDGSRASTEYDYDNEYTVNGVKYIILADTSATEYVFGVAWINNVTDDNDVQTWFGADPTLM